MSTNFKQDQTQDEQKMYAFNIDKKYKNVEFNALKVETHVLCWVKAGQQTTNIINVQHTHTLTHSIYLFYFLFLLRIFFFIFSCVDISGVTFLPNTRCELFNDATSHVLLPASHNQPVSQRTHNSRRQHTNFKFNQLFLLLYLYSQCIYINKAWLRGLVERFS